ncbi:unnamed protein product [Musa acuminata subsp. malaccensis]|nr:unnamed protein product [Musa acuminata subsp. malaccensis]
MPKTNPYSRAAQHFHSIPVYAFIAQYKLYHSTSVLFHSTILYSSSFVLYSTSQGYYIILEVSRGAILFIIYFHPEQK